jgi:hypothetical protein
MCDGAALLARSELIGQQIKSGAGPRMRVATIIGVVGDVRPTHRLEVPPQIYTSYLQQSEPNATLLVKTAAGQGAPIDAIKHAIRTVVPEQAIFDIRPLTAVIAQSTNIPAVDDAAAWQLCDSRGRARAAGRYTPSAT